jgi:outer membrane murein-binding lipoprotein Lpp
MLFTHSESSTARKLSRMTVAAGVLGALIVAGCSSSTSSSGASTQASARDEAAGTACQQFAHCDQIGAGKTYDSANQCDVQQRSFWDTQWPVATCDGKIDATEYQKCLTTISTASCGSAIDLANVVLVKCSSGTVCSAGPK